MNVLRGNKGGQLRVLSEDQVYSVHLASMEILERTGVMVDSPEARKILLGSGAVAASDKNVVRIPECLVMDAVRKAPEGFTLYARNPVHNVRIEQGRTHFGPMIGRKYILDLETGKRRNTNLHDVEQLTRLASALENYTLPHSGVMMPHIEGVPDAVAHLHAYLASVKNSDKVVKGTGRGPKEAKDCIRMAAILAGGEDELRKKPNTFTTYNVISPLRLGQSITEGAMEYARCGLPLDVTAEPQAGATAPITLAGLLAQQNAEILSGITLIQLVNPGTPVFYGTCGSIMEMKRGVIALGSVETGLINAAHAQIAKYYGIPSRGTGGSTEAKILDIQAGYEKAITLLMAAMSGISYIWYPGTLDEALTVSLESILIDHEICGMVNRSLRGITVDDDTLAVDVIEAVGPGRSYLGQRHTLDHLTEKEQYFPKLSDRKSRELWESAGSKDLREVARNEVRRILSEYKPSSLDPGIEQELEKMVKETK
jgi:trimethylamine--corrinoid protein Co-methyltransferase